MLDKLNEYRITPAILREIVKKITCDLCKKPIEDIEVHHFQWNRYYIMKAKCHGQVEDCKVTEYEFMQVMKNKFTAVVFKQAETPKLETTQFKLENKNEQ